MENDSIDALRQDIGLLTCHKEMIALSESHFNRGGVNRLTEGASQKRCEKNAKQNHVQYTFLDP